MKSDAQIQQDVASELSWDTRIQHTNVVVEVHDGVVALGGTLSDYIQKMAAQEAAYRVAGVLDIVNHISVHLPDKFERSDTDIAQAVRHVLEWDVVVPDTHIRSMTANGWVTLEGEVDTWHEREAAGRAVRNLAGVRGLINKLEVVLPPLAPHTERATRCRGIKQDLLTRRSLAATLFSGCQAQTPACELVYDRGDGGPASRVIRDHDAPL
jgi:osmotically-inducible protein OsmY